ncbi:septum site-determining protein MinC [Dehalobacterium formicoaceticum]|uniref:Septum site-determining protein MinC n=1 Tax=Dehalobacterium formicoaceticum TaxID=51515 RepID=A0ABT1Y293_9FIRM|nr:septum site-determining protein MinC [Dehalobacterium formicoaceticum]MCR6545002.1 septum site-determining protein MinC [Dehalobacterium formicoaceticum]
MEQEVFDGVVGEDTLLVQKTLRSGQSIRHSGNVVVLGDINPGAEIIAGGHVMVAGTVRGVVHAGASGNQAATITAFHINPIQLRIGSIIFQRTDENRLDSEHLVTARIDKGRIIIDKI